MATARSSQAHDKRVQRIAADAAEKIAADAPLEEDVIVVVEELPPGGSTRSARGRTAPATDDAASTFVGMVAQSQQLMAEGITRWIEMTTARFGTRATGTSAFGAALDPRHLVQETFRFAEDALALQKELALKVADAMTPARAA